MSAMEQFTEAFCEKAISVFIMLVPEINNAELEARDAALEAMRGCCVGIIERISKGGRRKPPLVFSDTALKSYLVDGPIQCPNLLDKRLEFGNVPNSIQLGIVLHVA